MHLSTRDGYHCGIEPQQLRIYIYIGALPLESVLPDRPFTPCNEVERLDANLARQSEVVEVEGASHLITYDQPAQLEMELGMRLAVIGDVGGNNLLPKFTMLCVFLR